MNRLNELGHTPDNPDYEHYYATNEQNLLSTVTSEAWAESKADLNQGAGNELLPRQWKRGAKTLPPKFNAHFSSSALCVNVFAPWRIEPKSLSLCGLSNFDTLRFEEKLDTGFIGVPNLDLSLTSNTHVIGCESKFLEWVSKKPKPQNISKRYNVERFPFIQDKQWWEAIETYNGKHAFVPAAQLLKHYVGLKCYEKQQGIQKRLMLLYLYWEPLNASDYELFRKHRHECEVFADQVQGGSVEFAYMSYPDLWSRWEGMEGYEEHLSELRNRYLVEIPVSG